MKSRRLISTIGIVIVAMTAGACGSARRPLIDKKGNWEEPYFSYINKATANAELKPLRSYVLPDGDYEVRIWRGFSTQPLEGFVMRNLSGTLTAIHVLKTAESSGHYIVDELPPPRSDWEAFIDKLNANGIFDLASFPDQECEPAMIDESSYVIELNRDGRYATHKYPAGRYACSKSREMAIIGEEIGLEFGPNDAKCERSEWFECSAIRRKFRLEAPSQ